METIKTDLHDDFTCKCGNTSFQDGFVACADNGKEIEPTPSWHGLYKCNCCNQIYKQEERS